MEIRELKYKVTEIKKKNPPHWMVSKSRMEITEDRINECEDRSVEFTQYEYEIK